jgi:hypothetical protein
MSAARLFVLLVQPLLVQPLLLPALARTSRQLGARPVGAPALPLAPRSRLVVGLADDDNINGYRELGLAEDATYDEVMDAFMSLSETYSDNPERMMTLELAKNKVLDERLKQRMSGSLGGAEASPWDERPVVRTPPWVYAKEYATRALRIFDIPTKAHAMSCVPLLGAMTTFCLVSPRVVFLGRLLMLVNSGMLIYGRNTDPVPRDEYGQVGEIRPMKKKPMGITILIVLGSYFAGQRLALRCAMFLGIFELRTYSSFFMGVSLILATLFTKAHGVFERDD